MAKKARERKKLPFFPARPPKEIVFRGKRYYLWREELFMVLVKVYAREAIARGIKVRIIRQRFEPGATIYTSKKLRYRQALLGGKG